jgi:hypothetical protein
MSVMEANVDPSFPGSRLDADHPENEVLIPRRITIGYATLAYAILDRVIHNAHRPQLSGDSLRKQKAPQIVTA